MGSLLSGSRFYPSDFHCQEDRVEHPWQKTSKKALDEGCESVMREFPGGQWL